MADITTNSSKTERSITLSEPDVLCAETLEEIVSILGTDVAMNKIKAQLKVDFRSKIRGLLESMTDDELTYSDDEISAMDFSDWKPEGRTRKSAEEKAMETLGKLSPDQLQAVLAALEG